MTRHLSRAIALAALVVAAGPALAPAADAVRAPPA